VKVQIDLIGARLRAPFGSAWGSVRIRQLLLLRLEDSAGTTGVGEAAPLQGYDRVGVEDVRAALEDCRPTLAQANRRDRSELLAECTRLAVLPQAVAAIDLALWDLEGRRAGQPVWRLIGASAPERVEVNYTIGADDRAGASREADVARGAGFSTVKLKVGVGDDPGRLAAVRAAVGPAVAIRLDANGAWSVPEALAALRVLEPAGIELCEEPASGLDAITSISSQTQVPISIDETAASPGALDRRACEAVCLKIARCGGITGVLDAARRARAAGYQVYISSTLDGPIGIAGALHAAAAVRPDRPCGLTTLDLFAGRVDPLTPRCGRLEPPLGAGLGDGLLSWYGAP
jgi:L-Ala-D/L-Glu epimerase / N-acetyl-D-glutamate racemase